jgi:ADP-ribose pyrophosphatase YjhB (NUDIX family)
MITKRFLKHIEEILLHDDDQNIYKKRIAAAGVVYKEDENGEKLVLLIQRAKDDHWPLHWEYPRGGCDKPIGESPEKCVIRETKEECGLDVIVEDFLGTFEYITKGGNQKTICYNYLCKAKNPNQKVVLKKNPQTGILEHESYKWISQIGEAELLVFPDQRKMLEKVLNVENPISNTPENNFTKNNQVEEFLNRIQ